MSDPSYDGPPLFTPREKSRPEKTKDALFSVRYRLLMALAALGIIAVTMLGLGAIVR